MTLREPVRFCIRCGAPTEARPAFGRLRAVCTRCAYIHFEDPKVAVAVFIVREGKVLLIQRGVSPERGKWSVPAGFVEVGEDPRQAAARECREETGLEVNDLQLRDVIARQSEVEGADILIVFEGTVASGVPQPGDDAERASFFGPNELPDLAFPSTRMILALWRNGTPPT
jgi:ADP-ribose pyrophosphatase YjhB (NUDIX family)